MKNKIAVLEKMSSDACNKLYDLEYEMQECQKSYSLQNNLCDTISYYISELNKLIKNEEVKNNKIKYTDDQIENAKLILKEVGVIK